jgi:tetratricopeptide (TPR) repeat protein
MESDGLGKWSAVSESLPGRIFISYRRQETAWPAGRLYDVLVEHFPAEQVFKDVDNIDPGDEFVERIAAAVESCDVLLALIGPQWLTITNKRGQRRIDDPGDYVRLEIEAALTRKIRVIPILVDEAPMPGADELPATLAPLVYRQAVEINPATFDTKRLISTVRRTLAALKVSDTTTGSASPTPTPSPDRSNQQVAGAEVEQLYDQALAAFWTEQWDKAIDLLGQVLHRQPDYAEAGRKLELARRQQQLASHYAQASAAADAGDWERAVAEYTMITDSDPDYRDTNARLAVARHQQQLSSLLTEAHRLHRAGQWAAVIKVSEQLQTIDPSAADPDGLMASARAELAAEQQAAQLATDYHTALRLFDAGRWEEAVEALERITRLDSAYQDAPALLDRARRELRQAAVLAEEQARREAEEQAARQKEHQPPTKPSARKPVPTGSALVREEVGHHAPPAQGKPPTDQTKSPHKQAGRLSRWVKILAGILQRPPDKREPTGESRAFSISPAAPGTLAEDQTRVDQAKSRNKQSGRLSRPARIVVGVLAGLVALVIGFQILFPDLLYEDFSSPVNGWDDTGSTRVGGHYNNGAYRIYAEPTGENHVEVSAPRDASSVYPTTPLNLLIDVSAKALAPLEANAAYGVFCRYGENSNGPYGYAFNVGPNYVSIGKYGVDGKHRLIASQPLPPEFLVNDTNLLQVRCYSGEGNQAVHLVFLANSEPAAEGIDSDNPLPAGSVALFAATFKEAKKAVEAEFDDLYVYE